jgi:hypothetical protein
MSTTYRYRPSNLPQETLVSTANVIAAYYVARKDEFLQSFGNRLKVLAVYADGTVAPTTLTSVIKQIREDDREVDLFHVTTLDGNRELPIVVI